jgi:hypothetical protein
MLFQDEIGSFLNLMPPCYHEMISDLKCDFIHCLWYFVALQLSITLTELWYEVSLSYAYLVSIAIWPQYLLSLKVNAYKLHPPILSSNITFYAWCSH